jgi:hypothetical protein
MYKVIKFFTDLQDGDHAYHEGETFPREGLTVTAKRLEELSSAINKRGVPLIEEIKDDFSQYMNPPVESEEEAKPKAKRAKKKG